MKKHIYTILALVMFLTSTINAADYVIRLDAELTAGTEAVNDSINLMVVLYEKGGTTPLWSELFSGVQVSNGNLHVFLGADPNNILDPLLLKKASEFALIVDPAEGITPPTDDEIRINVNAVPVAYYSAGTGSLIVTDNTKAGFFCVVNTSGNAVSYLDPSTLSIDSANSIDGITADELLRSNTDSVFRNGSLTIASTATLNIQGTINLPNSIKLGTDPEISDFTGNGLTISNNALTIIPGASNGQVLSWNHDEQKWEVKTPEEFVGDTVYTQTQMQTSGEANVHWNNIQNEPVFAKLSEVYTTTNLRTAGQATIEWDNIINEPSVGLGDLLKDGSVAMEGDLNLGDHHITNVGNIALDSISADNNSSFAISSDWTNADNFIADLGTVEIVTINSGIINNASIGKTIPADGSFNNLKANNYIKIEDPDSGTNTVMIVASDNLSTDLTLVLPADNGSNGFALVTDGAGNLSWTSAGSGDFLKSGSVVMTGDLDIGNNNINNVGEVALATIKADDGTSFAMSSNWTNAGNTVANLGTVTTIDLDGGTIDGTNINGSDIGGTTPGVGKFLNLQTGKDNTDGQLTIYSDEDTGDDEQIIFKPNNNMTETTTYYMPASHGSGTRVMVNDGSGNLNWTTTTNLIIDTDDDVDANELDNIFSSNGILKRTGVATYTVVDPTNWDAAVATANLFSGYGDGEIIKRKDDGSGWEWVTIASVADSNDNVDPIELDNVFNANGILKRTDAETYSVVDPAVWDAAVVTSNKITNTNFANWNSAFGWGDHSGAGYLTAFTETDPVYLASDAADVSAVKIANWDAAVVTSNKITNTNFANWNSAFGWGDHSGVGYLTAFTETDPVYLASDAADVSAVKIANWDAAVTTANIFTGSVSYTLQLPADDGDTDQVLKTDGNGNLSWATETAAADPIQVSEVRPKVSGGTLTLADFAGTALLKANSDGLAFGDANPYSGYKFYGKNNSLTQSTMALQNETLNGAALTINGPLATHSRSKGVIAFGDDSYPGGANECYIQNIGPFYAHQLKLKATSGVVIQNNDAITGLGNDHFALRVETSLPENNTLAANKAGAIVIDIKNSEINNNSQYISFRKGNKKLIGSISGQASTLGEIAEQGIKLESSGADYAEYLSMLDKNELISGGDIVGVFDGKITKKTSGAHRIMAISSMPIVLGNSKGKDPKSVKPVAFVGQVRVKVKGVVRAGDFIIPSGKDDGIGISVSPDKINSDQLSKIVGQAWESSKNSKVKIINVALTTNNNSWTMFNKIKESQALLRKENQHLQAEVKILKNTLELIKKEILSIKK